ncbi:MAG: hypothetical protein RLZZ324_218 [Candidatus Parcubacteria bacterium]|jgi:small subunit ribosomal protein S8
MITDPISDMLTRIRNASMVKKGEIRIPYSKIKMAIAKILSEEGYVAKVEKTDTGHGDIRMVLKYDEQGPVVRNIKRASKPGHRLYMGYQDLPRVLSDNGIAIVSTSQGLMTNKEARRRRLGGEVLCEVF